MELRNWPGHSSKAKAFYGYRADTAPSSVPGNMSPGDVILVGLLCHRGTFGGYLIRYLEVSQEVSYYSPAEWTHTAWTSKHGCGNAENDSSKGNGGAFRIIEVWRCDETLRL